MIKEVITLVDLSQWAQFSLLIFGGVFVAVSLRTLLQPRHTAREHARLVLDEERGPQS